MYIYKPGAAVAIISAIALVLMLYEQDYGMATAAAFLLIANTINTFVEKDLRLLLTALAFLIVGIALFVLDLVAII